MPESIKRKLMEVFHESQFNTHAHDKLMESLTDLYGKAKDDELSAMEICDQFIHYLKYPMVESKPEPTVERVVKFVAKFVARMGANEDTHLFFEKVVGFLLKSHEANDKAVRYRTCQLLALIFDFIGDAEIDDEICDQVLESMHTRLSDKVPSVRVQAIKALSRLQDPSDKHCPIIKAFLFLMSSDPNWQVRIECLRLIAPTKRTLHGMIERTQDIHDLIRKTAYNVIAEKVSVKALSISQRLLLLENGLADRSVQVKNICRDKLLQAWLVHYQANILDLLCGLDIMSSGDICEKAVLILLSKAPVSEIIGGLDLLNSERMIIKERLSCESAFYYRVLLIHISRSAEADEHLERLLPDPKAFVTYISEFVKTLSSNEEEAEQRAMSEFIILQLFLCVKFIDISDPVSRKSVLNCCKELLNNDNTSLSLAPELVKCLQSVLKVPDDVISEIAGTIADIQLPITAEELQPVDPERLHQMKYKLAGVNMNLNELSELLSEAVSKQDFAVAAEIKQKIEILEISKQALLEDMKPKPVALPSQPKDDDTTKLKCLTIFAEMMKSPDIQSMNDTIRSYLEELVIPAIPDRCPAVRNQAIKALGLCSLCDQSTAKRFLPVFLQICQMDSEAVRVSAFKALFDILLMHGVDFLKEDKSPSTGDEVEVQKSADEDEEDTDDHHEDPPGDESSADESKDLEKDQDQSAISSVNSLIAMMVNSLDDESSEVRTLCAEGLAKLLLSARICSPKLLSRLIILWYNPVTEDDNKLRHCLGVFLPVYAFSSRANQVQVEEAFLPTLKVLFDAPKTSPLSEIDEWNVAELLVHLTDSRQVKTDKEKTIGSVDMFTSHDSLAVKICNEMIEKGDCYYGLHILSKVLTVLHLSGDNEILVKDLKTLVVKLMEITRDKQTQKYIEKFKATVDAMKMTEMSLNDTSVVQAENEPDNAGGEDKDAADDGDDIDCAVLDSTALRVKRSLRVASQSEKTYLDQTSDDSEQEKPPRKSQKASESQAEEDY